MNPGPFEQFPLAIDAMERALEDDGLLASVLHEFHVVVRMNLEARKQYWFPRAQPLIMRILEEEHDQQVHQLAWDVVTHVVKLSSYVSDDPSPLDKYSMQAMIRDGMLTKLDAEIQRQPRRNSVLMYALIVSTTVCLYEDFVEDVVELNICEHLLDLVRDTAGASMRIRLLALITLTNIAIFPDSHSRLIESNAIEICERLLVHLRSEVNQELDFGLTAAFLICRIAGRDEAGRGAQSIHRNNDVLITKLEWLLKQVLDAGPTGIVLDSHWNPANIMLDISILAQSDKTKPLLKNFVPLICRCLREYGDFNRRLVGYCIGALVELYQHDGIREDIGRNRRAFLAELQKKRPYFHDIATFQGIKMLEAALQNSTGSFQDTMSYMMRQFRVGLVGSRSLSFNPSGDW
jgi:hypothetical protein